ncbi:acyl carrier protein [Leptolyngbya sp. AN03gr2]|uniref:acyl carrier protein n=1 Tax=unclassified Leptolyngbya TaxID=2650499 RepID=UPI003D3137DD
MTQHLSGATTPSETTANLQVWMIDQVAEQLGVSPSEIDPTVTLESYGLNSAQAMSIAAKAEALLGSPLSPILFWHYPTIAALAERLSEEFVTTDTEFLEL